MTDALKGALQVAARAVIANAWSLVTFIDVNTIVLAGPEFIASWTFAFKIALLVNALRVPAAGIRYLKIAKMTS